MRRVLNPGRTVEFIIGRAGKRCTMVNVLIWNEGVIVSALKISVEDVKEYFTDGRRVSFISETS